MSFFKYKHISEVSVKIIVLLKQTPDTETKIQVSSDGKNIDHSQTKFVVNPYDEYGIEEAIKIREKD